MRISGSSTPSICRPDHGGRQGDVGITARRAAPDSPRQTARRCRTCPAANVLPTDARVLMAEPNVLLLDEPTNDLDIDTPQQVEDILDSWAAPWW